MWFRVGQYVFLAEGIVPEEKGFRAEPLGHFSKGNDKMCLDNAAVKNYYPSSRDATTSVFIQAPLFWMPQHKILVYLVIQFHQKHKSERHFLLAAPARPALS